MKTKKMPIFVGIGLFVLVRTISAELPLTTTENPGYKRFKTIYNRLKSQEECVCYPIDAPEYKVTNILYQTSKRIKRLVVYIYQDEDDSTLNVYIPNAQKQKLFPDLYVENSDILTSASLQTVASVFQDHPQAISVDRDARLDNNVPNSSGHSDENNLPENDDLESQISNGPVTLSPLVPGFAGYKPGKPVNDIVPIGPYKPYKSTEQQKNPNLGPYNPATYTTTSTRPNQLKPLGPNVYGEQYSDPTANVADPSNLIKVPNYNTSPVSMEEPVSSLHELNSPTNNPESVYEGPISSNSEEQKPNKPPSPIDQVIIDPENIPIIGNNAEKQVNGPTPTQVPASAPNSLNSQPYNPAFYPYIPSTSDSLGDVSDRPQSPISSNTIHIPNILNDPLKDPNYQPNRPKAPNVPKTNIILEPINFLPASSSQNHSGLDPTGQNPAYNPDPSHSQSLTGPIKLNLIESPDPLKKWKKDGTALSNVPAQGIYRPSNVKDVIDPIVTFGGPTKVNTVDSFDKWFTGEINNIAGGTSLNPTLNIASVERMIQAILLEHGIVVSKDGVLTDSSGRQLNMSNLHIKPLLIGDSLEYHEMVTHLKNTIHLPADVPYLHALMITLMYPPKILGIVPLKRIFLAKTKTLNEEISLPPGWKIRPGYGVNNIPTSESKYETSLLAIGNKKNKISLLPANSAHTSPSTGEEEIILPKHTVLYSNLRPVNVKRNKKRQKSERHLFQKSERGTGDVISTTDRQIFHTTLKSANAALKNKNQSFGRRSGKNNEGIIGELRKILKPVFGMSNILKPLIPGFGNNQVKPEEAKPEDDSSEKPNDDSSSKPDDNSSGRRAYKNIQYDIALENHDPNENDIAKHEKDVKEHKNILVGLKKPLQPLDIFSKLLRPTISDEVDTVDYGDDQPDDDDSNSDTELTEIHDNHEDDNSNVSQDNVKIIGGKRYLHSKLFEKFAHQLIHFLGYGKDSDEPPEIRIIGGSPATGSGSPISIRGRSWFKNHE